MTPYFADDYEKAAKAQADADHETIALLEFAGAHPERHEEIRALIDAPS